MGWDGVYRGKGIETAAEKAADDMRGLEIVAQSSSGSTFYFAVRSQTQPGVIFAAVVLRETRTREIMSKILTDDMGPCECKPSAKVLDALTPTESPYALRWRERARANLADRPRRVTPRSFEKLFR